MGLIVDESTNRYMLLLVAWLLGFSFLFFSLDLFLRLELVFPTKGLSEVAHSAGKRPIRKYSISPSILLKK
jgi:hypothetical protein